MLQCEQRLKIKHSEPRHLLANVEVSERNEKKQRALTSNFFFQFSFQAAEAFPEKEEKSTLKSQEQKNSDKLFSAPEDYFCEC